MNHLHEGVTPGSGKSGPSGRELTECRHCFTLPGRLRGLRIIWDPIKGRGDLGFYNGALDTRFLLETMIIVSLFSDRRAEASDALPYGQTDPRGFWGDSYATVPNWKLGSRLWLLEGARATSQLPKTARGYILESLQWFLQDGIASAVDANVFYAPLNTHQLDCHIRLVAPAAQSPFGGLWREELGIAANDNFTLPLGNIVRLAA